MNGIQNLKAITFQNIDRDDDEVIDDPPCSPEFTIINGQIIRVKTNQDDDNQPYNRLFIDEDNPPLLGEQLKVIFILKNILGIKEEMLCGFLGKLDGALHPHFWLQVCSSCEETVSDYYRVLKQFLKLEKQLKVISDDLKSRIRETRHIDVDSTDGEGIAALVWSKVRAEVMKEIDSSSTPTHPDQKPSAEVIIVSPSFISENDECESEFEDKHQVDLSSATSVLNQETSTYLLAEPDVFNQITVDIKTSVNFESSEGHERGDVQEEMFIGSDTSSEQDEPDVEMSNANPGVSQENVSVPSCATQVSKDESCSLLPDPLSLGESSSAVPKEEAAQPYYSFKDGTETKYKCRDCVATYTNRWSILNHIRHHFPDAKSTPCKICGWIVDASKAAYINHLYVYHDIVYNKSNQDLIPSPFPSTRVRVDENGKLIPLKKTCDICGLELQKVSFNKHMKNRHPPVLENAGEVVLEENEYYTKVSRANLNWWKCKKCPLQFHTKKIIVAHLELHREGSKAATCEICKWVLLPDRIQLHNQNHHQNRVAKTKSVDQKLTDSS